MPLTRPGAEQLPTPQPARRYYLDWLRVIAIFLVFLVHVSLAFDVIPGAKTKVQAAAGAWFVHGDQASLVLTIIFMDLIASWGMAVFFLISGAASLFALRRRPPRQYAKERVVRLLIPFLVGAVLLTPLINWFVFRELGTFEGAALEFFPAWFFTYLPGSPSSEFLSPLIFGLLGQHLWFLGFLLIFSLLAIPVMTRLGSGGAGGVIEFAARLASRRGGLVLFAAPLIVVNLLAGWLGQLILGTQNLHLGWGPFFYYFGVFVLGALLFCDDRMLAAVRRDWAWLAASGLAGLAVLGVGIVVTGIAGSFISGGGISLAGWGLSLSMMAFGMRFLNHTNGLLDYSMDAIVPFYVLQYPVIITIAYYVVSWDINVYLQALIVLVSSFTATIAIIEGIIRPLPPLRFLLGMRRKWSRV